MSTLSLAQVSHAFGATRVLEDVSLEVAQGGVTALLGPSGCGKSTLLRIAAGLEPAQQGRIMLGEHDVTRVPAERRQVGLMFQDVALFPHLRVWENVAFGLAAGSARRRRAEALAVLDMVGMAAAAGRYPHVLSGGEQQRVGLARALAPKPAVMLLDEPFSALDEQLRDRVRSQIMALLRELGTTTLLVTHEPDEAMRVADRIALMQAGRIRQEGAPAELYHRPNSAFCARMLGPVNEYAGTVEGATVASPFGPLAADGLADSGPAAVLVRPEGLRLVESGGVAATVEEARCVGADYLLRLRLVEAGAPTVARCRVAAAPDPGQTVQVAIDPRMAFVFPPDDR